MRRKARTNRSEGPVNPNTLDLRTRGRDVARTKEAEPTLADLTCNVITNT